MSDENPNRPDIKSAVETLPADTKDSSHPGGQLKLRALILRSGPYIKNIAGLVAIAVSLIGLTVSLRQRSLLTLQNEKLRTEIEGLNIDNDNKQTQLDAQKAKLDAETQSVLVPLNEGSPDFRFTYVTMSLDAYQQFREAIQKQNGKKERAPLFPGCMALSNEIGKLVKDGGLSISIPEIDKVELKGGGNLDYFREQARKSEGPQNPRITCLVIQQDGKRVAKGVWVEAQFIPIAGAVSLPFDSDSPTEILLKTAGANHSGRRIGLGDLETGQGYIIPLFIAIEDDNSRLAFRMSFVPASLHYADTIRSIPDVEVPIRPMERSPFRIEGGVRYAG